jgi:galactose mutarotase-like enzyme
MQGRTASSLLLSTGQIEVEIRPEEGGRVASLVSLGSGLEFLTQSRAAAPLLHAGLEADFLQGACAGIEECLPTVGRSSDATEGGPAADHGDFWQLPWKVERQSEYGAVLAADGFSRFLRFEKQIELQGGTLQMDYCIRNIGREPQSFLYACHPLLAVDAGDEIYLPEEVTHLRLDYSRGDWLGSKGDTVAWPRTGSGELIDRAKGQEAQAAAMLYTQRVRGGACGIARAATGERVEIRYDHAKLPYLGVWLCYGGWPEGDSDYRQYAVALEPTTSSHNTLLEAQTAGEAIQVAPGGEYRFQIAFHVLPKRSNSGA